MLHSSQKLKKNERQEKNKKQDYKMKNIKPLEEMLDSVKDMEGFPIGKDEDILALSKPPYYTACPNPYINDFIKEHGKPYDEAKDDYQRTPFVGDVSEGKNDPIYNAHSYHTKVPHKAIMKYIEHYTDPGDIVFDGFCGTGMTGVAAQMLGRKAILSDLSPIATFIAHNYNSKVDINAFEREAKLILAEVQEECGWMYETYHVEGKHRYKGKINYTVWSDVFICPFCAEEIVFYKAAVNKESGSVLNVFPCLGCQAELKKTDCKRAIVQVYDQALDKNIEQAKQVPVLINYTVEKKRFEKEPEAQDLALIKKIEESPIPYWYPTDPMMDQGYQWGDTWRKGVHFGITHVHHFYTKRNLWMLAAVWSRCKSCIEKIWFTSAITRLTKMYKFMPVFINGRIKDRRTGTVSGTLYIPSMSDENSPFILLNSKISDFLSFNKQMRTVCMISNNSATILPVIQDSIDYIFTDPPFGDNLMYSELNFLWETWLKVKTHNHSEAIVNKTQNKGLSEYHDLMYRSFKECYRILKPNRWITVEFHNSKSAVWNCIQDSLSRAGFVVANVAVLDKKQGSFKQVTSSGSVKNDLVISAYKPKHSFQERFQETTGQGMEEDFIRMHLGQLPAEPSIERTEQMLYSRLLAFYVQRGYSIKYNASTFYKMLRSEFMQEDNFWFLPNQVEAYRKYKHDMKLGGLGKLLTDYATLFVADEKSAIIWLNAFLERPRTFQQIHPAYTKIASISGDNTPELMDILNENFVLDGEKFRHPQTDEEKLTLMEKRSRSLRRDFESILQEAKSSKKKIKEVRKQSVLLGFEECYKSQRFHDILILAHRLHNTILESDAELTEFVEVARIKVEGI